MVVELSRVKDGLSRSAEKVGGEVIWAAEW